LDGTLGINPKDTHGRLFDSGLGKLLNFFLFGVIEFHFGAPL
jgi:hypothetical protein